MSIMLRRYCNEELTQLTHPLIQFILRQSLLVAVIVVELEHLLPVVIQAATLVVADTLELCLQNIYNVDSTYST